MKFWIRGSTVRYHKLTLTAPEGGGQHLISNGTQKSHRLTDRLRQLGKVLFELVQLLRILARIVYHYTNTTSMRYHDISNCIYIPE